MTLLLVVLGGAAGAACRYLVDVAVRRLAEDAVFPWGTYLVNVLGSFGLGALTGWSVGRPGWMAPLVMTGLFGALTTYSTFSVETLRLAAGGATRTAVANALATVAVGFGAAWLGLWLVSA